MRATICLLTIALLTASTGAQTAAQPACAGEWVLQLSQPTGATVARRLGVVQTVTSTNLRGEPMPPYVSQITVERTGADGVQTETLRLGIVGGMVGGVVSGGVSPPANRSDWSVTWDGARLVAYRRHEAARGVAAEHHEEWALDSAGRLVITTTTRAGESRVVTTATYQKTP
jgi:hypothetical protein